MLLIFSIAVIHQLRAHHWNWENLELRKPNGKPGSLLLCSPGGLLEWKMSSASLHLLPETGFPLSIHNTLVTRCGLVVEIRCGPLGVCGTPLWFFA